MKKLILVVAVAISSVINAQFDDKFYQPSKEMKTMNDFNFTEFSIPVDQDQITGVFLKTKVKPKATVLFFHGTSGNISTYTYIVKPLVENGYQVMMIDFRGYGKSTGTPTHQNIANDGQIFFNYALKLDEVKNTPIILYGASMGTQIATRLAKDNNKIAGLVFDGGFSTFNELAAIFAPPQAKQYIDSIPFPYDAETDVKFVSVPKLFLHGDGDKTIPMELSKKVFEKALEPKKFVQYKGDHIQSMVVEPQKIITLMNEMFFK